MKQQWKYLIQTKSIDLATPQVSYTLQFWSLLIFGIPSLICSLFIFYRYLSDSTQRHAIHNHTILIIVLTNIILIFTDFSWMLDSLRRPGHVLSATPAFCMIWWFFDFTLYNTQTVILAWASIERHILIFHSHLVSTTKKKFYYHYLPLIILLFYLVCYHIGIIFIPPCNNEFEFHLVECGANPCFLNIKILALWDSLIHSLIPTFIIAIFSLALIYRVIAQKNRVRQPIQWRKHRRMSIQLLSLSSVYLFLNFPLAIIMLVQLFQNARPQFGFGGQLYIFFLTYSVTLSLPFVVYLSYLSNDKNQKVCPTLTNSQQQRMYKQDVATVSINK
jgi:hypothetical protein